MIKAGSHVISTTSSFQIVMGFKPTWTIMMVSSQTTEDTWGSAPTMSIGWSALANSQTGASMNASQVGEIWLNPATASAFVGNIQLWMRTGRDGTSGFAMYPASYDTNGVTMQFSDGYTSAAIGKRIYWLAGDEAFEYVGSQRPFVPGSPALNLGWEPSAMFGVGSGGGVGAPGGVQNIGWVDISTAAVAAGGWPEEASLPDLIGMWRGIADPNVDLQSWWGSSVGFDFTYILEGQQSVGTWFSSIFDPSRTDTTFSGGVADTGGFSAGAARMGLFLLGQADSHVGSFLPSTTVGVPTQEVLPFEPEGVVFFSNGEDKAQYAGASTQGATGYGWLDPEGEQALMVFGGHWNPPNPYQSAILTSSQNCWVGNYLDEGVSGTVGTKINMGTAEINGSGFTHTTTEHAADPGEVYPVLYWAFGPGGDESPGFFRVIN